MAWVVYEKLEFEPELTGRSGKKYSGWKLYGLKKGYGSMPDMPYEKTLFDNSTTTVIEKGVKRPNLSIVEFIKKACKPGDLIDIKNQRRGQFWEIVSIENIAGKNTTGTYEPLTDEQADRLRSQQELEEIVNPAQLAADSGLTNNDSTQGYVGYPGNTSTTPAWS